MNSIQVQSMQTPYGYEEQHLMIDGVFLPYYVDAYAKASKEGYFRDSTSLLGLYPAWGKDLLHTGEIRFIWKLIGMEEPVVLPVLVCEDDLDLSCLVIVVSVRKDELCVYWDKIGFVSHEDWDLQQELRSGVLHLESYTEEDWEKYGDNIALEQPRSEAWKRWISENWDEELFRRRMNGTLLYYQNEKHIVWLKELGWVFEREDYESCVEIYRRNLPEEKIHF